MGLLQETAREDEQREEFANKLRRIGLVAIALITFLALALLYLDLLFARAREKDGELQNSADRLRAIVSASLDGIIIANNKGEILNFNDAATEIFGWSRDEIMGRKLDDTIVPHQFREPHGLGFTIFWPLVTHSLSMPVAWNGRLCEKLEKSSRSSSTSCLQMATTADSLSLTFATLVSAK